MDWLQALRVGRVGRRVDLRARVRFLAVGALLLAIVPAAGCARTVTVAAVETDPSSYYGQVVIIMGEASGGYEIAGHGLYELRDATGKIWVVTSKNLPVDGTQLSVRGRVNEPINLGLVEIGTHVAEDSREIN